MPFINQRTTQSIVAAVFFLAFYASYVIYFQPRGAYAGMKLSLEVHNWLFLPSVIATASIGALFRPQLKLGSMYAMVVFVFVYYGILIVGLQFLPLGVSITAFCVVTLGVAIIVWLSGKELPVQPSGHPKAFTGLVGLLFTVSLAAMVYEAYKQGWRFPGFIDIAASRETVSMSAPARYAMSIYTFVAGPTVLALGLFYRRPLLVTASIVGFVLIYGLVYQRTILMGPVWIVVLWMVATFPRFRTVAALMAIFTVPFFAGVTYCEVGLPRCRDVLSLFPYRMYAIPGQIFGHYVDLFSTSPHTWFSHITGINWFIDYPFAKDLPLVIKDFYPGGNQNANFISQDAVAGAGLFAVPFVCALFGALLVVVNTAAKGLRLRLVLPMCAMSAFWFANGTLATGLLTGGLGLIIVLLYLAPRQPDQISKRIPNAPPGRYQNDAWTSPVST